MLTSFDGLAVRQLRTRRLRSILTTFGIVLGVGMVFGVLTLTGTIRSTFDDVISSAWGSKDLIVTPAGGGGLLREDTVERARAIADRVVFLRDGRVCDEVEGGSTQRVIDAFTAIQAPADEPELVGVGGTAAGVGV